MDKVETSTATSASEAVKAAAKAKSIQLNSNLNLKELFNEESDQSSQSKPCTSDITVMPNHSNTNEVVDSQSDKEDTALLVSLYHSYAKVPAIETSSYSPKENVASISDDKNDHQETNSSINQKDKVIDIQPTDIDDEDHNDVSNKKIKMPIQKPSTNINSIDDDDDVDYFGDDDNVDDDNVDDDDDDDEFQKIKQKYSLQGESGYADDFEDCGF